MDSDVIVIGLGAAGSAALRAAARRGVRCLGIEQFDIAHDRGSSHGRSRLFRSGTSEGPEYVDLAARSRQLWSELEQETGEEIVTVVGGLSIADAGSPLLSDVRAAMDARDLPYETLDAATLRSRYPQHHVTDGDVGVLDPGTGVVRPELAIRLSVEAARRAGAEVRTGVRAVDIAERGDRVEVRLSDGSSVSGSQVVVAAGAWTSRLQPDYSVPLVVRRAVLSWFHPREGAEHRFTSDVFPVFTRELGDVTGWGAPVIDEYGVKIGLHDQAGFEIDDPAANDPEVASWELERVEAFCAAQFADLVPVARHARGCMITLTPDERFAIGRLQPQSRIVTLAACSGHGFKHSAAVGELGVQIALDEQPTVDPSPFDPTRYTHQKEAVQ
ncbi:N-methyl-L-tryptophan oxidase [Zhihengliuella sp. ISTPL4]|uniref:N-methyl-L-tryptophan oxidase n=1 Tax=Zhihengliuella sp. ISTPL4 TaxID=2058657 RepID=UPI000C7D3CE2|nr:N-methyl-L-tryptophan oxidase [Zhihengliuella sp. ISTPL4]